MGAEQERWKRMWGSIAWWITVCYSVPFGIYTLPFISGKFELYKHLTVSASYGRLDLAGLHILNNLRTWQVHALAALLFVMIGPFQFSPSFRNKNPVVHKRLGYVFALCTIVTAVTGSTTMTKASELGPIALGMSKVMGPLTLIALAISINAARNRDFQTHRRWMLRSAAIGYAVMYTRTLPIFLRPLLQVSQEDALDYSFIVSWALNMVLAEIYIQTYLTQSQRKRKPKAMDSAPANGSMKKVS